MAIAKAISNTIVIATRPRFGLVSSRVAPGGGIAGSTVVGAVGRLVLALVLCGRTLVSISVAADVEPSRAVPASLPNDEESLTSTAPSARQKTSASSVSRRLHVGLRFILECGGLTPLF